MKYSMRGVRDPTRLPQIEVRGCCCNPSPAHSARRNRLLQRKEELDLLDQLVRAERVSRKERSDETTSRATRSAHARAASAPRQPMDADRLMVDVSQWGAPLCASARGSRTGAQSARAVCACVVRRQTGEHPHWPLRRARPARG